MKHRITLYVLTFVSVASSSLFAQSNVRRFSASPVTSPYLTVEGARVLGQGNLATGALTTFEKRSLILVDDEERTGDLLGNRLLIDASFAYGILNWLDLGAVLPIAMGQTGLTSQSQDDVATFALGDPRIGAKFSLLPLSTRTVATAIVTESWIPVGDPEAYAGEAGWGGKLTISTEVRLPKQVTFAFNAGYKLRPEAEIAGAKLNDEIGVNAGIRWGVRNVEILSEFNVATDAFQPFGQDYLNAGEVDFGARFSLPAEQKLVGGMGLGLLPGLGTPTWRIFVGYSIDASIIGASPSAERPAMTRIEQTASTERQSKPSQVMLDTSIDQPEIKKTQTAAIRNSSTPEDVDGDGLPDQLDACPDLAEDKDNYQDGDGCPDLDNDLDNIPDTRDSAPNTPEDWDGFEDSDGRPDPDNDKDGIADTLDKCPLEPGFGDGCPTSPMNWQAAVLHPDFKLLGKPTLLGGTIYPGPTVQFDMQNDSLTPSSARAVERIAQMLRKRPDFARVEVGVYVQTTHGSKWDKWLSQERAQRLSDALAERGVNPDRLFPFGYGSKTRIWTSSFGPKEDNYFIELRVLLPSETPRKTAVLKRPKNVPVNSNPRVARNTAGVPLRKVVPEHISPQTPIEFVPRKAILTPDSLVSLAALAKTLKTRSDIAVLEVGVHTDSLGNQKMRRTLSQARADAVSAQLKSDGVSTIEIKSVGYGADKPVAPNTTIKGRKANRRVEFRVLDRSMRNGGGAP